MSTESKYGITRNIEASVKTWLEEELEDYGWKCRVELEFSEAYRTALPLPCIVINADDNPDKRIEIGSNQLSNYFNIEFRIFATGNGQRLDLRDWLRDKVMEGIPYYEFVIDNDNNTIQSNSPLAGRISIIEIIQNRRELRNTDNTDQRDRSRHLLSFSTRIVLI